MPHAGKHRKTDIRDHPPLDIKPGSAGKLLPGFDVRVVDDDGHELPRGQMGNIVIAAPLAPTAFRTLWEDEERFYNGYLKRFGGRWVDTGDAGIIDEHGYVHIMSRTGEPDPNSFFRLSPSLPGLVRRISKNILANTLFAGISRRHHQRGGPSLEHW